MIIDITLVLQSSTQYFESILGTDLLNVIHRLEAFQSNPL
jgi:hypothetical protein